MAIKTLHLTNAYHERSGGIRTMYHALMAQAEREGRHIRLVVPADDDGEESVNPYAVIHRIRAPHAPAFDRRYRIIPPTAFLLSRGRVWRLLEQEAPDVVEVCDKYSLCYVAGLLRRRRRWRFDGPTLVGLTCERLDDNLSAFLRLPRRAAAAAARAFLGRVYTGMFDAHLANSEYTAEELRRAMTSPHLRPVRIAPMGVDLPPPIDPDRRLRLRYVVRSRLQVQASARIVLYAGRLSPEKNVDALVDVAARLASRNRYLVIAGDGPQRDSMTRACAVAAPGVTRFVNHVNRDGMWELLAAADVFVHPNPREPFGIGPLEAMAAGVPVVLPRAGGLLTYATDENAWLVDPSASSLAGGVDVVLDTPRHALERKLSAARVTAAVYAWPASAARMLREYDRFHDARMAGRRFEAQTTIATRNPRPATRSSA